MRLASRAWMGLLVCLIGTLEGAAVPGTNDMFAGRDHVDGTNWTYSSNVAFATREPEEPQSNWTNTVWMSWVAPFTGRAYFYGIHDPPHDYAVYTGSTLEALQLVPLAGVSSGLRTTLTQQGVEYHFQFTGGPEDFALAFYQMYPFVHATNDNFASAQRFQGEGNGLFEDPKSFFDAGMELGEPFHLGNVPHRSLWYVWQAPRYGYLNVILGYNFLTNAVVLAVYQGSAVDALTLIGKGTNSIRVPVAAGETYYVAAAVPDSVEGDVLPNFALSQASSATHPVPGNLLGNPSFEGGETNGRDWSASGELGGQLSSPGGGGADGSHWPYLPTHVKIWQDIPTIPGHLYRIRFAYRLGAVSCCGIGGVQVLWDENDLGTSYAQGGFWHWSDYFVAASTTTSRVTWTNLHVNLEMDAFSVIDMNAPPVITREPVSLNTLNGGTAVFSVDSLGTRPLFYQWLFNNGPTAAPNEPVLALRGVNPTAAGQYSVIITNNYGAVTSAIATLTVESPTNATILVQPYGDTIPAGGYYNLSVVAAGLPPLRYQWLLNGTGIANGTNRNLTFTNVGAADAGKYEVLVQNAFSSVYSLPAILVVTNPISGGAMLEFRNRSPTAGIAAPVYDVDGTPLAGDAFVAQLFAGITLEGLRAVSAPIAFRTNALSLGYFLGSAVVLPNIPGGIDMLAQIRVWESAFGSSYEEARARGGKFGKSQILQLHPNLPPAPPTPLFGLESFALQAGLAGFSVGTIEFVERLPGGVVIWSLQGEPGFRYVVEKSMHPHDPVWRPYAVLTNVTGKVTFSDSANSASRAVLYRSRILD